MPIAANVHLIPFLYVHNTPFSSPLSYCYKQFILPLPAVRRAAISRSPNRYYLFEGVAINRSGIYIFC